jgi:hypothetical protein
LPDEQVPAVLDASHWLLEALGISRGHIHINTLISMLEDGNVPQYVLAAKDGSLGKLIGLLGCSDKSVQPSSTAALWSLLVEQASNLTAATRQHDMQRTFRSFGAAICYVVMLLITSSSSSSSSSTTASSSCRSSATSSSRCSAVVAAAEALCSLAAGSHDGQRFGAAVSEECMGLTQLLASSYSQVRAAAAMALVDLAGRDEVSRQQAAATVFTVDRLLWLLSSHHASVQEAAAAALCALQQEVRPAHPQTTAVATVLQDSRCPVEFFKLVYVRAVYTGHPHCLLLHAVTMQLTPHCSCFAILACRWTSTVFLRPA